MYDYTDLEQIFKSLKGKVFKDFNLGKISFFKTGGNADYLFIPNDITELQFFLRHKPKEIPIFVIGNGSNLLVRDGGIRGVVLKFNKLTQIQLVDDNLLFAECGVLDQELSLFAANNSIAGFEFLFTIPGTVGGSIVMNAGAYNREIKDIFVSAQLMDNLGNLHNVTLQEAGFSYRSSCFQSNSPFIVLGGYFQASNKSDKIHIHDNMKHMEAHRRRTQPLANEKTSGSTFKNPTGYKAWELIQSIDGRNLSVGGARVSAKHSNFLINAQNASASDIENLGELIRNKIQQKFNILLEWEIQIVGQHQT